MPRGKHRNGSFRPSSPDRHAGPAEAPQPAPRRRAVLRAVTCAVLVISIVAAFGGLRSSGFILFDDDDYVTENAHVQKGMSGESIAWAFTSTDAANWHPLTWLSHMLDVQLFGLDAGKHHLTSLLLHAVNALLLFLLLFRMTGALWRSAFVAALFALHPLHVESVAWIAERKDVLSTLFWLLTLGVWLGYAKSRKSAPYALALVLFALGLMAKPMLVTLPFTLLLLDYWPLRRLTLPLRWRSGALQMLLLEKAPFFLLSAASCVITFMAQRNQGAVETLDNLGFGGRLANAALAYIGYLGKTIWPASLAVFYPHPHIGLFTWAVFASALLLAGATFLAIRFAKRAPYLPFGWFWYLGTLMPVIGFVQVGEQAMADRYTYVPLIGVFIALAWGLAGLADQFPRARIVAPGIAAVSLAALFPITRVQTGFWVGTEALFGHALSVTSNNWKIHTNLGVALGKANRLPEAIEHCRQAVRIKPDSIQALNNLGMALEMANRFPEAIENLSQAVRLNPDFAEAQYNLGIALADTGRLEGAVEHYRQALRIKPDSIQTMNNLGLALGKMNRLSEATDCFRNAVRINPDFVEAQNNLGVALASAGRTDEAIEHYRSVLRIQPGNFKVLNKLGVLLIRADRMSEAFECFQKAVERSPDFAEAHNNLGFALYRQNRIPEAIEHFAEAVRIEPNDAQALDNLGLAFEKMKRYPEALERFRQAVRANPGFAGAHDHLGIALVREHRLMEAQDHFEQALRLNPDFEEARAGLRDVRKALGLLP